jgi:hypothetical protein
VKELEKDHLTGIFSNKFGDDFDTVNDIHQRMKEIK